MRVVTAVLLATLLGVLGGCDAQDGGPGRPRAADSSSDSPGAASSATPGEASPTPSRSAPAQGSALAALPAVPTGRSAASLAAQIGRVGRVLRDPDAPVRDVRRAAEFSQLVARLLATRPQGVRRDVLSRLGPRTRAKTRLDVGAAVLLDAMTTPQARLPKWRITEPPPPRDLLGHYRFAARRIGVPWNYLAAIHLVETRMGRIRGVSSAGAKGPMQFLPTTWELYGRGGDINNPRDAILAAARLLRANGAPGDMAEALWHYNPSDSYVGAVTRYARSMGRSPFAYRGYWHWRVLYKHVRGTYVLDRGYPDVRARLLG